MGLRETMNRNRRLTIAATVAAIILVAGWILWQNGTLASISPSDDGAGKTFFTDDDGATWFVDSAGKVPPFNHNGKEAVACFVYKNGDKGKPWVSSLLRYTPEGKKSREARVSAKWEGGPRMIEPLLSGVEVKKPGTGNTGWVKLDDPRAPAIQEPRSPDGSKENIMLLLPE